MSELPQDNQLPYLYEKLADTDPGIVHIVGSDSLAVITRLSDPQPEKATGNILRRTCQKLGENACAKGCGLRFPEGPLVDAEKLCADANLSTAFRKLGIQPEKVLMVGVTANDVGFADKWQEYTDAGKLTQNPEGWFEMPGFNAFFARPEDASEIPAIGSRLADCAHLEFEFKDADGQTVIGFEHGTRPNMKGSEEYAFEDNDGKPVSYTHHVLAQAIAHYGADPATMRIRLSSSIRAENFVKHFGNAEQMDGHIPGWFADGFVTNVSNPDWKPGDPIVSEDEWHADARGMILRDTAEAMQALGIPSENLAADDMLDPADSNGAFSSHENRNTFGDSRDLYLVAHQTAFTKS